MSLTLEPVEIRIPLRDGGWLAAQRFDGPAGPAPVVVMVTPYRREGAEPYARLAMDAGCHFVCADVHGLGGSTGVWQGSLSAPEIGDGAEALEWLAGEPWCNGRTALVGSSYCGANQLLIAARRPRGLACIAPAVAPVDTYRDMTHRGGIPCHPRWAAGMLDLHANRPDRWPGILREYYDNMFLVPCDGPHFRDTSPEPALGAIEVPALVSGGWYDFFLRSAPRAFRGLRGPRRLVIGQWQHEDIAFARPGELLEWLRYWLHGEGVDPTSSPNVLLQDLGTGEWSQEAAWPTPADIPWEVWHPVAAPLAVTARASMFDRGPLPVPFHLDTSFDEVGGSGMRVWGETLAVDAEPAVEPVRYLGPVALRVALASEDASDLDVMARLWLVRADGSPRQLTEGRLRASHRALAELRTELSPAGDVAVPWHPHDRSQPLLPGTPAELEVEVDPVCVTLAPGERLRLGLAVVRSDGRDGPAAATLLPRTRVLLPRAAQRVAG